MGCWCPDIFLAEKSAGKCWGWMLHLMGYPERMGWCSTEISWEIRWCFFLRQIQFQCWFPEESHRNQIRYLWYKCFFCFDWWQNKTLAGKASCFETISDMEVSSYCSSQSKHPFHGMFGKFWGSIFTGPELVLFRTLESCLMSISWCFTWYHSRKPQWLSWYIKF